jgi:hypothetical protein
VGVDKAQVDEHALATHQVEEGYQIGDLGIRGFRVKQAQRAGDGATRVDEGSVGIRGRPELEGDRVDAHGLDRIQLLGDLFGVGMADDGIISIEIVDRLAGIIHAGVTPPLELDVQTPGGQEDFGDAGLNTISHL